VSFQAPSLASATNQCHLQEEEEEEEKKKSFQTQGYKIFHPKFEGQC